MEGRIVMVTDADGGVNSAASNLDNETVLQTVLATPTESQGESRMVCFSCLSNLLFSRILVRFT